MTSVSEPVMSVDEAIEIVARQALANAAEDVEWDEFPEISECDWDDVLVRMAEKEPHPLPEQFAAAYKVLEDRAKEFEDD